MASALLKNFYFVGPNDKTFVNERSNFRRKRDSHQRTPLSLKRQCHNQAVERHVKTVMQILRLINSIEAMGSGHSFNKFDERLCTKSQFV